MMFVAFFALAVVVCYAAFRLPPEFEKMTEEEYLEWFRNKVMGIK